MRKSKMLELRLEGESYREIASKAGISRQRIQQLLAPPKIIREIIVKKADGKCQNCGIKVGRLGNIHHNGDLFESYNDLENLQLLCISCHRKVHQIILDKKQIKQTFFGDKRRPRKLNERQKLIKIRLLDKGMAQVDLARLIGVSEPFLSMVLAGKRKSRLTQMRIAQALGLEYSELWGEG